jgi:hypothetical protein
MLPSSLNPCLFINTTHTDGQQSTKEKDSMLLTLLGSEVVVVGLLWAFDNWFSNTDFAGLEAS